MSQKNETGLLVASLILTAIFIAAVAWWVTKPQDKTAVVQNPNGPVDTTAENPLNSISFGEKILVPEEVRGGSPAFKTLKQAGVNDIAAGKYNEAVSQLSAALRENRNAPETLIYLNNARINLNQQKSYTIAVAVPIGSDPNGSLEVLRGVALAQNEINQAGGINGVLLKVAIANDNDQEEQAKKIASALVDNKDVLGVVGHWASQVTLAVAPIYDSSGLVAISPVSTAVNLSGKSRYIFRTVPSDYIAARALADYMLAKLQRRNVAVFFNSKSTYSQSLKSEFVTAVSLAGGQVKNEYDLSDSAFSAARSVEQAIEQGAEVLMLASNTGELDKALQVVQVNRKRLNMLAGDDVYAIKTLEIGADAALGMVVAVPWDIDGDPTSAFPRQARELFGSDVNWRTALAYDAARALIAAIQRNPTRTGVQQALASPDFATKGASGTISFLPSGDRNGTIQLVKIVADKRSPTTYDFVPVPR